MKRTAWLLATAMTASGGHVAAASAVPAPEEITITAVRLPVAESDLPASVDTITGDELYGRTLGVNLSESLSGIAGLLARDRQNYAQDTQVSIRGFGARATFGIRGLRLYVDDIPATQPDGQGQISHVNLATAERVEILRGPFSALYGNSSGGVIALYSADGTVTPEITAGAAAGSHGSRRTNVGARGTAGIADYNLGYTHFRTDGYRDHSAAVRDSVNGRLNLQLDGDNRLSLTLNLLSAQADDPLGLSREQAIADPRQATPQAHDFDTRKGVDQLQGGAVYERRLAEGHSLRLLGYYGRREVLQYLAIPVAVQANPRHSGGVVDLDTAFYGSDLRWTWQAQLMSRPLALVGGLAWEALSQHRRGHENFSGDALGVRGSLRRDEDNAVQSLDPYLQADWRLSERGSLLAGIRHSRIAFDSRDRYVTEGNPDDSGSRQYNGTLPVAGLMFRVSPQAHVYASYGEGFETPTIAELAYRAPATDGTDAAGLNLVLDAARSRNVEIGAKLRPSRSVKAEFAVFQTRTRDELVVETNTGGRATYTNAGRTRRQGAEASLDAVLLPRWRLQLAYTGLDARVREDYRVCSGTPCGFANTMVEAGSRLPGVPQASLFAGLRFGADAGWQAAVDARYVGEVAVNDLQSESAGAYTLIDLSASYRWQRPKWNASTYLRLDNAFNEAYIGSVIVNDGNGRYYEPGPGRTVLAGLRLDWKL